MSKLQKYREAIESCRFIIKNDNDFEAVKPLIEAGRARLVSVENKNGESFKYKDCGTINAQFAGEVKIGMVHDYAAFLGSLDDVILYTAEMIDVRDKTLSENPLQEGETPEDHFLRVAEESKDGWLVPLEVEKSKSGFYRCDDPWNPILLEEELCQGCWSYSYDNWKQYVVLAKPLSGSNHRYVELYDFDS